MSRRTFLRTTAAAGLAKWGPAAGAKAAQPRTEVDFAVPPEACDCHVHVFDPRRFPYASTRTYTPEPATLGELRSLLRSLHLERVVIVQPSVYGTDNACTLDALRGLGARARGVAVIGEGTPEAALYEMDRAGVRGIRLNLTQTGVTDPKAARRIFRLAVGRIVDRGWHVQVNCPLGFVEVLADMVQSSPVPVVFDHFGGAVASRGIGQAGFGALVRLVGSGKAYAKISGAADSLSTQAPDYADAAPFAQALVAANSERILWGSNWPHPGMQRPAQGTISPLLPTDDGLVLNLLPDWVPEARVRRTILVDNPAGIYAF